MQQIADWLQKLGLRGHFAGVFSHIAPSSADWEPHPIMA